MGILSFIARPTLAIVTVLLVAGCGPMPTYHPPEGPGAYLQNRLVERGDTRFFYFFEVAGDDALEPAGINKAQLKTRAIFKTNSPYDATYKIRPGTTVVGVRVVYVPHFGGNMFTQMNDLYYHIFVRNTGMTDDQIDYISENVAIIEADDLRGMQGLEIVAEEGATYQANSSIEGGKASVWIEKTDGTIVSRKVIGFGDSDPVVHGALYEMYSASFNYPEVGLPDPSYGWGPLTNLPDPPN
jgi:hypothetical protein